MDRKEREFRGAATTILLKLCMPQGNNRLQNAKKFLVSRSKWHMTRVMSLSSQIREFQALSAVGNFPLLQTILCKSMPGKFSKNEKIDLKGLASDLCDKLRIDYNDSQVAAIAASVGQQDLAAANHQLALVQGPPGECNSILTGDAYLPGSVSCLVKVLICVTVMDLLIMRVVLARVL